MSRLPPMTATLGGSDNRPALMLDFRTGAGVPYASGGRYFDSIEHWMAHQWRYHRGEMPDNRIESCRPWLTADELAELRRDRNERQERARLALVSANQPWDADRSEAA